MSRRSLVIVYAAVIFLMVWGFDLINAIKFREKFGLSDVFGHYQLSQTLYAGITFWLTHRLCSWLFPRKRFGAMVLGLGGLIVVFVALRFGIEQLIYPHLFGSTNYPLTTPFLYYFLDNIYYAILYIALGFGVFLLDQQVGNQKKNALLQQQNREAELQFLRSQINPHFLFNTLNNIYSLVYEQSPKAPSAMLQLSELMRYMLYEKKDLVPVSREWSYIKSFITLQQLRFEQPLPLLVVTDSEPGDEPIPPYILISFVENAFKHGDFRDPSQPLSIRLASTSSGLQFDISNKIGNQQKDKTGGVGLENVKRRLELLYPQHFEMTTRKNNSVFTASLILKF